MMKHIFILLISLLTVCSVNSLAQTPEEYEAAYNQRIQQEMIDGVYIPVDLQDAFNELNRLSEGEGLTHFKNAPEEGIDRKLHFGLGKWIMKDWGLEEGSRSFHFLRLKGVSRPDDMVRVIILTWHRFLNQKPLQLEEEVALIQKNMEAERAKREAEKKVIVIERRPHKD